MVSAFKRNMNLHSSASRVKDFSKNAVSKTVENKYFVRNDMKYRVFKVLFVTNLVHIQVSMLRVMAYLYHTLN